MFADNVAARQIDQIPIIDGRKIFYVKTENLRTFQLIEF